MFNEVGEQSPRVVYKKPPLVEVLCQYRYPPILRVEAATPSDFQDRVRKTFPLFEASNGLQLPVDVPPGMVAMLGGADSPFGKQYEFSSKDKSEVLTLSKDALTLRTVGYNGWPRFKQKFLASVQALLDIYEPLYYTRIGLRYVNVIRRKHLDLVGSDWSELLNPSMIGVAGGSDVPGKVVTISQEVIFAIPETSNHAKVRHGFVLDSEDKDQEQCYLIDSDYYTTSQTEISDAAATLDTLNRSARRLFRWCIKDKLHEAMGPDHAVDEPAE